MKYAGLTVAICLTLTIHAKGQIDSGTVVVVGVSKDKVVMAADSRTLGGRDASGNEIYYDRQCKLAALGGKVLYATSGLIAEYSKVLPDGLQVDALDHAREAVLAGPATRQVAESCSPPSCHAGTIPGFVESIGDAWWTTIATSLMKSSNDETRHWLSGLGLNANQVGITGIFAGITPTHEMEMVVRGFACRLPLPGSEKDVAAAGPRQCSPIADRHSISPTPELRWYAFGITDITSKNIDPVSLKVDWPNLKDWQIAVRLVDLTIAFSSEKKNVHQPIVAVELGRDGAVTWLQNEQNCPQN
jgi:hypothetical protein